MTTGLAPGRGFRLQRAAATGMAAPRRSLDYLSRAAAGVDTRRGLPHVATDPILPSPGNRVVIRHIVLVRFAAATPPAEIDSVFAALADLGREIPGLRAFASGPNMSPEQLSRGFSHAFTVDFDDVAARDSYLVNPAHQRAGARLVAAAEAGLDGLAVLDIAL